MNLHHTHIDLGRWVGAGRADHPAVKNSTPRAPPPLSEQPPLYHDAPHQQYKQSFPLPTFPRQTDRRTCGFLYAPCDKKKISSFHAVWSQYF